MPLSIKMNYKQEPYPEKLVDLLNKAIELADGIIQKLSSEECYRVDDLYEVVNGKVTRNKYRFDSLGYFANEPKNNPKEYKGLYIFGEEINEKVTPVYIGISRSVFRRLKQHAWGTKHNECSLAYLKTRHQWQSEKKEISRATIKNQDMLQSKAIIQNYKVVLVEVQNDYDLYFLEVALAGIFRTKWNSFKTH